MLNQEVVAYIARLINNAQSDASGAHYKVEAEAVLAYFVDLLQERLNRCLNAAANNGVCDLTWKHDECLMLMELLHNLTMDDKYAYGIDLGGMWD
jgi:hypothetical protein